MRKMAVVVGVSKYEDQNISDLNYASDDAIAVADALREVCGFDDVRLLISGGDIEPTHVNVVDALQNLAPFISEEDLFLFYFGGHGIHVDGAGRLLTSNSRLHMPELASLDLGVLTKCFSRLDCRQRVIVMDACRNNPHTGKGDAPNVLTAEFSRDIQLMAKKSHSGAAPTTCLLFSCSEGERAYEWPETRHGAFTYYLLEGLRKASNSSQEAVTIQALSRYVEETVPRWSSKMRLPQQQTPWSQQIGSLREIALRAAPHESLSPPPANTPQPSRVGNVIVLEPPRLHVDANPSGANVIVDGKTYGCAPISIELAAGIHSIHAEKPGYGVWERRIQFDGEGDARLAINLPALPKGPQAGESRTFSGIKMVWCPPGEFMMGSPASEEGHGGDESPLHRVTLTHGFWLGKYEVTQAQWEKVMGTNPSYFKGDLNLPVDSVSWNDCQEFIKKLNAQGEGSFRLPSEAEWEYACRAGVRTRYSFGDSNSQLDDYAWFYDNSGSGTHPVGKKKPSAWGLYDMHGNVWEWCQDWFHSSYTGAPTDGSAWESPESYSRVLRGGSWNVLPGACRAAYRSYSNPDIRLDSIGFRLLRTP
jgi:formylglycine-generating enzyme required for sulfatase activity